VRLELDPDRKEVDTHENQLFFRTIALLAAIALTVPAFAKPFAKTINIAQNAKLGKSELKAGEYRLQIDGTKARSRRARRSLPNPKAAGKTAAPSPPTTPC